MADRGSLRTGIADVLIVWVTFALVGLEILVTYTRTPVHELYHVRTGGIAAGAGRAVAFVGFPLGLAALAVLPIVIDRARRRHVCLAALAAIVLATAVLWPGALDEAGLDATPARVLAAAGVCLALALTLTAWRSTGAGAFGHEHGDRLRLLSALMLAAIALPWMAADLGLSLDHVPGLGSIYLTDQLASQPSRPGLHPSVHDGHHHGMDGVLLAWTALLLTRALPQLRHRTTQIVLATYASFLLVYGVANALQDVWTEQIVKRGWTSYELPNVLVPSLHLAWLVIAVASAVAAFLLARATRTTLATAVV